MTILLSNHFLTICLLGLQLEVVTIKTLQFALFLFVRKLELENKEIVFAQA